MITLENWSVVTNADAYTPPELIVGRLTGMVYGHPNHYDGKEVVTSPVIGCQGDLIVTKTGSLYGLGKIDPEYAKLFPDAQKRLFESLKEFYE